MGREISRTLKGQGHRGGPRRSRTRERSERGRLISHPIRRVLRSARTCRTCYSASSLNGYKTPSSVAKTESTQSTQFPGGEGGFFFSLASGGVLG